MRALAFGLFLSLAACAPPETNARIEVQPGAAGRICFMCAGKGPGDSEACPPAILDACSEYASDLPRPPVIYLVDDDGGVTRPSGVD